MERFKSIPGSRIRGAGKFDNDGFLETADPKAIESLKKNKFVEHVSGKKDPEAKKDGGKKDPEAKK